MIEPRAAPNPAEARPRRLRLAVRGAVQGVGFRPFVYRLAGELALHGWCKNTAQGVQIEVEGPPSSLATFLHRLQCEPPTRARIHGVDSCYLAAAGYDDFQIKSSDRAGTASALVQPDIAMCAECRHDIDDPANRRYRYPFTNCTNCGPRFSIIDALPYDRAHTTMKGFSQCAACLAEYNDPGDRRFHAQPNACPACGPQVSLWDQTGQAVAYREEALAAAVRAVRDGKIVALKGLGGFHLLVHAGNDEAVERLRERKQRGDKPFAVMYPCLDMLRRDCAVSLQEERLLLAPEAPIVLVRRSADNHTGHAVAPGNPYLGAILPYTPLHYLILSGVAGPVVATSGNRADEPICTDEHEALQRLNGIADCFLVHDRPIRRHVDDSVARVMAGREMLLRRARGYAPLPIQTATLEDGSAVTLAAGAHQKNCVAFSMAGGACLSQHIGDLETPEAIAAWQQVVADLGQLTHCEPHTAVCDLHPDYASTKLAQRTGLPLQAVQHHLAHALACLADNELQPPALAVTWDGTGLGSDGSIWGGEFILVGADRVCRRVAYLRPFCLPGGEAAMRQPRRSALGVLYELGGAAGCETLGREFTKEERQVLLTMLERGVNSPTTTSAGRLFDAVANLVGLGATASYEGQRAAQLEYATSGVEITTAYTIGLRSASHAGAWQLDWGPVVHEVLHDLTRGVSVGIIAARFHNALAAGIVMVARQFAQANVLLTGGCFQNRYLLETTIRLLEAAGFRAHGHQRVPCNDGGIALGQLVAARMGYILNDT